MNAPEKIRLFVGIFPPAGIVPRLAEAARALAGGLSPKAVAWTRPDKIHLTLNFLGQVERARLEEVQQAVETACQRGERHLLQARGLGCFPSPARPRIIWAGLAGTGAALEALKQALDDDLARLGFIPEERPFHPHLTIGRVKTLTASARRQLADSLSQRRQSDFGPWPVERVDLMQSVLAPAGSEYSRLQSFTLPPPPAA